MLNNNYQDIYERLLSEEETLNGYLDGCSVSRIQYHSIVYELPMYVPFEVPFKFQGYEPTEKEITREEEIDGKDVWITERRFFYFVQYDDAKKRFKRYAKMFKEVDMKAVLAPITYYMLYFFVNKQTGNTIEISYSSKRYGGKRKIYYGSKQKRRYRIKEEVPYAMLRVKFESENEGVMFKDILLCLAQIMHFNMKFIEESKRNCGLSKRLVSDDWFRAIQTNPFLVENPSEYLTTSHFKAMPFNLFYAEPSVDIRCPTKESADYIHNCFMNLCMKRYRKLKAFKGNVKRKKRTKDGRLLKNEDATIYISDRTRAYPFKEDGYHHVRFEFQWDKDYLNQKVVKDVEDMIPKRNAKEEWDEKCSFYGINVPRLKKHLYRKYPTVAEQVLSTVIDCDRHKSNGQPFTDWEKIVALRAYKYQNKMLLRNVRDYITPKWFTLKKLISDAFARLSLHSVPIAGIVATPVPVPEPRKFKTSGITESTVIQVLEALLQEKKKITWQTVMDRLGIKSKKLLAPFGELIKEYKQKSKSLLMIASCSTDKGTKRGTKGKRIKRTYTNHQRKRGRLLNG